MNEGEATDYPIQQPMPWVGHTSEGALQYQLESKEEATALLHAINGEEKVRKDGKWGWVQTQPAMVNTKGLSIIKGYLTTYLNSTKTFALTDVDEDYVEKEVISISNNLIAELYDNWDKYEVRDLSSASFIVENIAAIIHAVLCKGVNGTYMKFLSRTHNIQEVQHHAGAGASFRERRSAEPSPGVLGVLFGRKRR